MSDREFSRGAAGAELENAVFLLERPEIKSAADWAAEAGPKPDITPERAFELKDIIRGCAALVAEHLVQATDEIRKLPGAQVVWKADRVDAEQIIRKAEADAEKNTASVETLGEWALELEKQARHLFSCLDAMDYGFMLTVPKYWREMRKDGVL